jgi:hypothetical protein
LHDEATERNEGADDVGRGVHTRLSGASRLDVAERVMGELVGRHADQKAPVTGLDQA